MNVTPNLNEYHPYDCAFCGETNEVFVDAALAEGGPRAVLTEDCAVCCRPNLITIFFERDGGITVTAEPEYEA